MSNPFTTELAKDLEGVLNRHSIDACTDTPDYILADMLLATLINYNNTIKQTKAWGKVPEVKNSELKKWK